MCYERKEIYTLDEIFAHVYSNKECKLQQDKATHIFDNDLIKMTSDRYLTFKYTGHTCVQCGLVGTYFAKERHKIRNNDFYHFNLYGINSFGEEIMLTKDHIKPKSLGGQNILMNYQTLCIVCNQIKKNIWNKRYG